MAERRMFAKTIIDSDAFLDMPVTARLLYYDLAMRADDDGFVNSPKKIMRMVGASQDDLMILAARKFIIPFDSGVVVIKHWRIHNYIRQDRYHETPYKAEKSMLKTDNEGAYLLSEDVWSTNGQPVVNQQSTEVRLGKDSIGQVSIGEVNNPPVLPNGNTVPPSGGKPQRKPQKKFVPPTVEEVEAYCFERNNRVDAEKFVDYYNSNGWKVGRNPMKDWKAAVRTWERNEVERKQSNVTRISAAQARYAENMSVIDQIIGGTL